jgi:hypothetical protein
MEILSSAKPLPDLERTPSPKGHPEQCVLSRNAIAECLSEEGKISPVTFAENFLRFEKNDKALSDLASLITEHDVRDLFAAVKDSIEATIVKRGAVDIFKAARGACGELYLRFVLREMMERVPLMKEQQIEILSRDKSASFELDGGDHRPTHQLSFKDPFNCHLVENATEEEKAEFDSALVVGDDGSEFYLFDICLDSGILREKILRKDNVFVGIRAILQSQGIRLWKFHVLMCNRPAFYVHQINDGVFITPMQRQEEVSKLAYAATAIPNPDELNGDLLPVFLAHLRNVQNHRARQRA